MPGRKTATDRFSSVREMLTDLDDIQRGHPPRSEATIPVPAPTLSPQVAAPADRTVVTPSSGADQTVAKPQPPRMPPPATPLRAEAQAPRPSVPAPEVTKPLPRPPSSTQVSAPPSPPRAAVPPSQPVAQPPAKPGQPLMGKTLVMRVPDLANASSPSSPQGAKVPPAPPDSTLMGRTLPMRVHGPLRGFIARIPHASGNAIADSAECSFAGKYPAHAGSGPCRGYAP